MVYTPAARSRLIRVEKVGGHFRRCGTGKLRQCVIVSVGGLVVGRSGQLRAARFAVVTTH